MPNGLVEKINYFFSFAFRLLKNRIFVKKENVCTNLVLLILWVIRM